MGLYIQARSNMYSEVERQDQYNATLDESVMSMICDEDTITDEMISLYNCQAFDRFDLTLYGEDPCSSGTDSVNLYKSDATEVAGASASYGSYNTFRDILSQMILKVPSRTIYESDNPEQYNTNPIFQLIMFSDCEGLIDYKVAKEIYEELSIIQEEFIKENPIWEDYYNHLLEVFRLGSQRGIINFG